MRSHSDFIRHKMATIMKDEHTLSEIGLEIVRHHFVDRLNCCELCDAGEPWDLSRHLVGFPNGKEKHLKMAVMRCGYCGNTKTIAFKSILQFEKLRLLEALGDNKHGDVLVHIEFKQWQADDAIPLMPAIMADE